MQAKADPGLAEPAFGLGSVRHRRYGELTEEDLHFQGGESEDVIESPLGREDDFDEGEGEELPEGEGENWLVFLRWADSTKNTELFAATEIHESNIPHRMRPIGSRVDPMRLLPTVVARARKVHVSFKRFVKLTWAAVSRQTTIHPSDNDLHSRRCLASGTGARVVGHYAFEVAEYACTAEIVTRHAPALLGSGEGALPEREESVKGREQEISAIVEQFEEVRNFRSVGWLAPRASKNRRIRISRGRLEPMRQSLNTGITVLHLIISPVFTTDSSPD